MQALAINRAWDETAALWQRERRILVTVTLALVALPQVIGQTVLPDVRALGKDEGGSGLVALFVLAMMIIASIGQLALMRFALVGGERVADTLRMAARRLWPAALAAALLLFPLIVAMSLLRMGAASGIGQSLLILALAAALLYAVGRVALAGAVAVSEPGGAVRVLRRTLDVTRGAGGRLAILFLAALTASALVGEGLRLSLGSLVLLALGAPAPLNLSALLLAMLGQAPQAFVGALFATFMARLAAQRGVGR